jgi:hypothetical protein
MVRIRRLGTNYSTGVLALPLSQGRCRKTYTLSVNIVFCVDNPLAPLVNLLNMYSLDDVIQRWTLISPENHNGKIRSHP